jgi:hypothetical protein
VPYVRAFDFFRSYFNNRLIQEDYNELKSKAESLKISDFVKNRNAHGIVNIDKLMDVLVNQHQMLLGKARDHVEDLFDAFDVID